MDNFADCIVTLIDLTGIKTLTREKEKTGHTTATLMMQGMHLFATSRMPDLMERHSKAYVWNDSIILLAYIDPKSQTDYVDAIKEADQIKRLLDEELATTFRASRSAAVAVKGRAFQNSQKRQPRVVYVETTGYAMANCFEILERFSNSAKKPRKHLPKWYIDARIYKKIRKARDIATPNAKKEIQLLPYYTKRREVIAFPSYLWEK